MDAQGIIQEILPYVKKIILGQKDRIESEITAWLKKKGFFAYFIGTKFIPIVLDLIIGPLLPFIITTTFNVICGTACPYLKPFFPLIDQAIMYVNEKYLSAMERERVMDIIRIIVNHKDPLPKMDIDERLSLLSDQEYFSSI